MGFIVSNESSRRFRMRQTFGFGIQPFDKLKAGLWEDCHEAPTDHTGALYVSRGGRSIRVAIAR